MEHATDNARIVEKIRKLLNLGGNNPNENEANNAIMQAHRLMAKHNISEVELEDTPQKITHITVICEHKGDKKFRYNLGRVIAQNFRCRYFIQGFQVAFFGRSLDAMIAREVFEYAYAFANKEAGRLYRERRQRGLSGSGVVNSYAIGFINGLSEKLEQQSTALMVVVPQDVNEEYEELSKDFTMKQTTVKITKVDEQAYRQGMADGRTVLNGRRLNAAG